MLDIMENKVLGPAIRQGIEQGKAEGRAEGKAEGRAEGKAEMLAMLMSTRFGALPARVRKRLDQATEAELTLWAQRFVTASTLDGVFAGPNLNP